MFQWIKDYKAKILHKKWKEVLKQEKGVWAETFYTIFERAYMAAKAGVDFNTAWAEVEEVLNVRYKLKGEKHEEKNR